MSQAQMSDESVRIDSDLMEQVRALANENGRTIKGQLKLILLEFLFARATKKKVGK